MSLKAALIKPFAKGIVRKLKKDARNAVSCQKKVFHDLLAKGKTTLFGKEHRFQIIQSYQDYCKAVPIRGYEDLRPYIERIRAGEKNVLWPGLPRYFAKTSGTTSGIKYIPITNVSLPYHVNTARNGLLNYYIETNNGSYFGGKMLYLSGSPKLDVVNGIDTGRLSGIVNHQIPPWLKGNKLPSYKVNCIDAWEEKVDAIVAESMNTDLRLIGGIPPWVIMYFERLLERTGRSKVKDVFPNLSLFIYGGVNYEPYRSKLETLIGGSIDSIETYPASEGFFAFQNSQSNHGLLLNINAGMLFEFVPVDEIFEDHPKRLLLSDVEIGVNYALIVNSNAGLWAYNIGDTIEFVSLDPPKIIVTGRIKHFISAFGEHVISKEVEQALLYATQQTNTSVVELTVAPEVDPQEGLPYHEWFIEFADAPADLTLFEKKLDESLQKQNIYYRDLIEGKVLRSLKVTSLKKNAFRSYMQSIGKLGGQNKVPRLANDRKIAEQLNKFILI